MTWAQFLDSKWFVLIAGFILGMLIERLHVYRTIEKQRAFTQRSKEIVVELGQVHGWMKTAGTPQPVVDRVERAAAAIHTMNEV